MEILKDFLSQIPMIWRIFVFALGLIFWFWFVFLYPSSMGNDNKDQPNISIVVEGDKVVGDKVAGDKTVVIGSETERGTWSPCIRYSTGDPSRDYIEKTVVTSAEYILSQGFVKISFDFSVDLKRVPRGSALAIGGLPVIVKKGNVTEFNVHYTGLNYSGELTVRAGDNSTQFYLFTVNTGGVQRTYVTDGSEGSVRFWGYIVYEHE